MSDEIGQIGNVIIHKYDVLQISDNGGASWLDFSALRDRDEVQIAADLISNRGGIRGHRIADYRIMSKGQVIVSRQSSVY
jgi:hypothetical protein